jgi:hypothetical protein
VPTVPSAGIHALPQRGAVLMSAFGGIADIGACPLYPPRDSVAKCLLYAKSGQYAVQQKASHSIRPAPGSATNCSLRLLLQKSVLAAPA